MKETANPTIRRRHNLLQLLMHFEVLNSFGETNQYRRNTTGRNIAKSKELK